MPNLLTFAEAGRLCGVSPDTIYRWTRGLRGVKLAVTYVGASPRVTKAALAAFHAAQTAARQPAETS